MSRLLVVEDQKKLLTNLQRGLEEERYEVVGAATGEHGDHAAITEPVDAVVLDLMLPGRGRLTVLRDLRAAGFSGPIPIVTAPCTTEDRVQGLGFGADDYLVKPFAFAERIARCCAGARLGANFICGLTTWSLNCSPAASSVAGSNWTCDPPPAQFGLSPGSWQPRLCTSIFLAFRSGATPLWTPRHDPEPNRHTD